MRRSVDELELMDLQSVAATDLAGALRFLEWTNRNLGGHAIVLRYLDTWHRRRPRTALSILDVGTGLGDGAVALVEWGRRREVRVRVTGIDSAQETARLAKARCEPYPEIEIVHADLASYSACFPIGAFDYVVCSLVLHHLVPESAVAAAIREMDRLAARGVIIGDLSRSALAYWSLKALTGVLGGMIVRHDGPLSVRRSFTPRELARLAADEGLTYLRAKPERPFRLSLAGEKP